MKWVIKKIVGALVSFALLLYGLIFVLSLVGFEPIAVTSSNVCQGLSKGDLCFTYAKDTYKKGDIIAIEQNKEYNFECVVSSNEDSTYNITGDTEDLADAITVSNEQIIGKFIFGIPFAGYLVFFLSSVNGTTVVSFVLATLILLCILCLVIRLYKRACKKNKADNSIPIVNTPNTKCAGTGIIYNDVQEFWRINGKPPRLCELPYEYKVKVAYDKVSRIAEGSVVDWLNKQPSRFVKQLGLSFMCDNAPEEEIVDFWERVVEEERKENEN